MSFRPEPYDLLRLCDTADVFAEFVEEQTFVEACVCRTPWVVVRRAVVSTDRVAVGVRGGTRTERYAAWIRRCDIVQVLSAEALRWSEILLPLPAFESLRTVEQRWRGIGLVWGPVGSVGFAIAADRSAVHEKSDLDLLLRMPEQPKESKVTWLMESLAGLSVRVDVQVQTPCGYVALAELVQGKDKVLLRKICGDVALVKNPWQSSIPRASVPSALADQGLLV